MSGAPLAVAVVGAGRIGARRAEVARAAGHPVRWVCDVDEGRAAALAAAVGARPAPRWEEAVADPAVAVVVVATPPKFLAAIGVAALRAGKHVLCEKPMGRTPAEVAGLVDEARAGGRVLKAGFNHRHHPAIAEAHALAASGRIGEIAFLRCRYGHGGRPGYEREWRADPDLAGGGELLDQGLHALDLFRWFVGDFAEATGFVTTRCWPIQPLEDNAFALLRTAKGQVASLHASWTQWRNLFSFEVFGQHGHLAVEGLGGSYGPERLLVGRRAAAGGPPEEEVRTFPDADRSWAAEWTEFVQAIAAGREPLGSGADGWEAMRLAAAIYEASASGRTVRL
jgi:predicted dehydrogenase